MREEKKIFVRMAKKRNRINKEIIKKRESKFN